MLEFKHPTKTTTLSALDFFHASTRPKATRARSESRSSTTRGSTTKIQGRKTIEAACILPTVIFLGTEMFTPAEKTLEVPEIVVTTVDENANDPTVEMPAS